MMKYEMKNMYFLEEMGMSLTAKQLVNYGFTYALKNGYDVDYNDIVKILSEKSNFDSLSDVEDVIDFYFQKNGMSNMDDEYEFELKEEYDYEFEPEDEDEYEFEPEVEDEYEFEIEEEDEYIFIPESDNDFILSLDSIVNRKERLEDTLEESLF